MPTRRILEGYFTLRIFERLAERLADHLELVARCNAIEQATYDREFWELVNAA